MRTLPYVGVLVLTAALAAAGCGKKSKPDEAGSKAKEPAGEEQEAIVSAPTLDELKRGVYTGIENLPPSVTLMGGRWQGDPSVEGSAARPALQFVRNFRLVGDLDRDGDEDAVVLLGVSTGGTGELVYLAVVLREGSAARHAVSALLGDRVQVREARIDGDRIVLGLLQAGKSDAMCCPGELVERAWTFSNRGLEEVPTTIPPERLSLATLAGKEWVLRSWTSWADVEPEEPAVTLQFEGDRIAGNSGCNTFFARLTSGKQPGDVSISPLGGTRFTCQDPAFSTEARFKRQIRGLRKYGFMATQLVLSYEIDGSTEFMLFDARPIGGE